VKQTEKLRDAITRGVAAAAFLIVGFVSATQGHWYLALVTSFLGGWAAISCVNDLQEIFAPPEDKRPVVVMVGVLQRAGLYLVGLRPYGKDLAGKWEFPGGKLDQGETPEEALVREFREELSIDVEVGGLIGLHEFGPERLGFPYVIRTHFVHFTHSGQIPLSNVHDKIKWVSLTALAGMETTPSVNETLIASINDLSAKGLQ
jgi:8-oxo-dGTP diphosphatase